MKLNLKKMRQVIFFAGAVFLMCGVTTNAAASVVSDNVVHSGLSKGKYFIVSYFNPSHRIESGEGYGLKKGKYVKRAYVRVKSDGLTTPIVIGKTVKTIKICASYDSGRCYSEQATKKKNTIMSTPKETVPDCSTCTQRLYYGWKYF